MAFKHRVFSGLGIAGIVFLTVAVYASYAAIVDHNWAAGLLAVVLAGFGGDAVHFELNYAWTNGGLQERYKLWKKRRFWKYRQQEHLMSLLMQDEHWMANNPIVATLTNRYIRALGIDWYADYFEDSSKLRTRLGLDPNYRNETISTATHVLTVYRRIRGQNTVHVVATLLYALDAPRDKTLMDIGKGMFEEYRDEYVRLRGSQAAFDMAGEFEWGWDVTSLVIPIEYLRR